MEPQARTEPLRGASLYDTALDRVGGCRIDGTSSLRRDDLHVALYEAPPCEFHVESIGVARLRINLSNAPVVGRIGSTRGTRYAARRYSLFFTPADSDSHWATAQRTRYLNIYIGDRVLGGLADEPDAMLRRGQPLLDAHLGRIRPWVDALALSIEQDGPPADDASLGLAHLIVAELANTPIRRAPVLDAAAVSRVQQYVGAKLGETIRVSELAALAGLPVRRFVHCFRASMGCLPQRYLLNQRIDAAMRLLQSCAMPIAAVAAECGFASQQHMTTTMRRIAGVTPFDVRCCAHPATSARAPDARRVQRVNPAMPSAVR